eukprot:4236965-Heterocapsa_arctica.AAC.1
MEQVNEIKHIANSIRDLMRKWTMEESGYTANRQEDAAGSREILAQAAEDIEEPQGRTLSAQQQTMEDDVQNIVGYR